MPPSVDTDPTATPLERLIEQWGGNAPRGISDNDIHGLETRYAVELPADFQAYLQAAMPEGNDWDREGTRWWPLSDIKSMREECVDWNEEGISGHDKLIVFADYLVWCYAWAVDCSDTVNRGKVALIGDRDHYIAESFDDFLERYLRDDLSIHR